MDETDVSQATSVTMHQLGQNKHKNAFQKTSQNEKERAFSSFAGSEPIGQLQGAEPATRAQWWNCTSLGGAVVTCKLPCLHLSLLASF